MKLLLLKRTHDDVLGTIVLARKAPPLHVIQQRPNKFEYIIDVPDLEWEEFSQNKNERGIVQQIQQLLQRFDNSAKKRKIDEVGDIQTTSNNTPVTVCNTPTVTNNTSVIYNNNQKGNLGMVKPPIVNGAGLMGKDDGNQLKLWMEEIGNLVIDEETV